MVILALAACASSQQSGRGDLTGKVWLLAELMGKLPVEETSISAQFTSDGKVSGSAGCNQYYGSYTVSGSRITISSPLASTMMMCEPAVMEQEDAYLEALRAAKTYSVKADQLTLIAADGTSLVILKAQSQDLAGSSWEATSYNNGKQAVTSVLPGTSLTARFGKDGTLSGNAGCNTYSGAYRATGSQVTIGPLASTMMACDTPAGAMEQEAQFLTALQNAAAYRVMGNRLELRTKDGALAADFSRK